MLLRDIGYETLTAVDGTEALDRVRSEHPDQVTLAISMPKVSGTRFDREVMTDPQLAPFPSGTGASAHHRPQQPAPGEDLGAKEHRRERVEEEQAWRVEAQGGQKDEVKKRREGGWPQGPRPWADGRAEADADKQVERASPSVVEVAAVEVAAVGAHAGRGGRRRSPSIARRSSMGWRSCCRPDAPRRREVGLTPPPASAPRAPRRSRRSPPAARPSPRRRPASALRPRPPRRRPGRAPGCRTRGPAPPGRRG